MIQAIGRSKILLDGEEGVDSMMKMEDEKKEEKRKNCSSKVGLEILYSKRDCKLSAVSCSTCIYTGFQVSIPH